MTASEVANDREQRKIREVAREYRQAGYEVLVAPGGSDVPAFLGDYRPDIIVRNDRESVVIEVKAIRGFDRSPTIQDVASRVSKQLGWRFELVVTSSRRGSQAGDQGPWELPAVDIHLKQIHDLLQTGQPQAAFLLLWANTEALLRRLALQEGVSVSGLSSPQIVKQLATQGVLERSDYSDLEKAASLRNSLAHGFGSTTVEPQLLKRLLAVTEGLREEVQSTS